MSLRDLHALACLLFHRRTCWWQTATERWCRVRDETYVF